MSVSAGGSLEEEKIVVEKERVEKVREMESDVIVKRFQNPPESVVESVVKGVKKMALPHEIAKSEEG